MPASSSPLQPRQVAVGDRIRVDAIEGVVVRMGMCGVKNSFMIQLDDGTLRGFFSLKPEAIVFL
jgi:hypothetical protein